MNDLWQTVIDLNRELDQRPTESTIRLALADVLTDLEDPRADGYRVLALWDRSPYFETEGWISPSWVFRWTTTENWLAGFRDQWKQGTGCLPGPWWEAIVRYGDYSRSLRRDLEDTAALAFGALPTDYRDMLLRGPSS
jgi:hypothetical protein